MEIAIHECSACSVLRTRQCTSSLWSTAKAKPADELRDRACDNDKDRSALRQTEHASAMHTSTRNSMRTRARAHTHTHAHTHTYRLRRWIGCEHDCAEAQQEAAADT